MKNIVRPVAIIVTLAGSVGMAEAQQPKNVPRIGYLSALKRAGD